MKNDVKIGKNKLKNSQHVIPRYVVGKKKESMIP
jgi:hypothetical protein